MYGVRMFFIYRDRVIWTMLTYGTYVLRNLQVEWFSVVVREGGQTCFLISDRHWRYQTSREFTSSKNNSFHK